MHSNDDVLDRHWISSPRPHESKKSLKAVLATYADADVSAIIRHHGMPRLTEKSIVRAGDLFRELAAIRRQGFAVDDEEACTGLRCVAAVVFNDCGEALAAMSVSGMTSRVTEARLPELGRAVREVAAELTTAFGGVMPEAKSAAAGFAVGRDPSEGI